jgi:hypothetical protein
MRIAAQLGELAHLWEIRLEIGEEATGGASKDVYGTRLQGSRESLDAGVKNLTEYEGGQSGILREDQLGLQGMALGGNVAE